MPCELEEFDRDACSFVIRMWRERAGGAQKQNEWRGWIEHVQSHKRVFFRNKVDIITFINGYLNGSSTP
jgi:hypothetical protein